MKASTISAITDRLENEKEDVVAIATASKPSRKARFRAIRVAAIAACLVMALAGGVAYAAPASTVAVTQGGATVNLGVNVFGVIVSAASDSAEGKEVVGSSEPLFKPYDDALARVVEAFDARNAEDDRQPIDVRVESGAPGQRERLEEIGEPLIAEHNMAPFKQNEGDAPAGSAEFPDSAAPQEGAPQGGMPQGGQDPSGDNHVTPDGQAPNDDNPAAPDGQAPNGVDPNGGGANMASYGEPASTPAPQDGEGASGGGEGGSSAPAHL